MRRLIVSASATACLLALPAGAALAASPHASVTAPAVNGTATGTVTAAGGWSFTIQTPGRRTGVVNAMIAAANAVTRADFPYVWGGGHAEAGIASVGIKGPGHNGRRRGLDCSGSVAAVLAGGGLWPAGASVPNDAGVIAQLRGEGILARGPGRAPLEVTLYDEPGVHIFMNIGGRFFGTSDGGGGNPSQRHGGAGWLNDGAYDAYSRAFKKWHIVPSVLHQRTSQGRALTFEAPPVTTTGPLLVGDKLRVSYRETRSGILVPTAVAYVGATTVSGTVQAIAADGSSVTVQTPAGQALTLSTGGDSALIAQAQIGDTVQVTYARNAVSGLVARTLTVTAVAAPAPAPTATDPTATDPTPADPGTTDPTSTDPSTGYPAGTDPATGAGNPWPYVRGGVWRQPRTAAG